MNASNSRRLALPKPRPKAKVVKRMTARSRVRRVSPKRKKEMALVAKVFKEIEDRDGRCWLYGHVLISVLRELGIGWCQGDPTPAHLEQWRRGTCKLPAEQRSTRQTIVRMCQHHHSLFDQHRFSIEHGPAGADGPMSAVPFVKGAVREKATV